MELFIEFINDYGVEIIMAVLTFVAGILGTAIKKLYTKYVNNKVTRTIVKTAVMGVEQMYKELHGEEKLNAALVAASEMLETKGIIVTEFELRMLIEAAVGEFNKAFDKSPTVETTE